MPKDLQGIISGLDENDKKVCANETSLTQA